MERCWDGRTQRRCLRFSQAVVIASVCASLAAWTLAPVDVDFLKAAAASGTSQLTLAKLALEKSGRPDIKMFAHQMVTDYERENRDLRQLAGQKKVKLPDSPNLRYGAEKARFQLLSDEQFDKSYVTAMIDDYTKDIQAFQDESGNGIDSDVKQFASKNLPIVREHLIMMKAIQGKTTAHNSFERGNLKPVLSVRTFNASNHVPLS